MSDAKKAKTEGPTTRELDRTGVYPGLSSPNTLTPPFTHAFPPHTDPTNQKRLRMRRRWLLRLQL